MLKFFKRFFKRIDRYNQETLYDRIIDKATKLKSSRFKYVWSSNMSIFYVRVPIYNIVDYTKWLNKFSSMLQNNTVISAFDITQELRDVQISAFFTDKKGFYVNETEIVEALILSIKEFALLYKEMSLLTDENFTREHNLAMLTHVLGNVSNLLDELNAVD